MPGPDEPPVLRTSADPFAKPRCPWPFFSVLALEVLFAAVLVVCRRGVIGHDAFQYFGLQYSFLSNASTSGELAEWMPFMTHGTVSNWWYSIQAGLIQASLLALGPATKLLAGANFLWIYYAGLLFDVSVYLLGLCLLCRRFFKSDWTILFVGVSAAGSSVYFTQPWHGLHFFYAIPLILEFLHRFVERRRWRYACLAGNLLALQGLATLPYQLPMIVLAVFLYSTTYVALYWKTLADPGRELLARPAQGAAATLLVAATFCLAFGVLKFGTSEIATYSVGRNLDGTVESVESFLKYGNNRRWFWSEALTRTSIYLDYNLYFGILALGFVVLGLTRKPSREHLLVLLPAAILFLISLGTPLARLLYYSFPLMKYYRHLTLASMIVRTFLVILSGFGFERIALTPGTCGDEGERRWLLGTVVALMALATGLLIVFLRPDAPSVVQRFITHGLIPDPGSVTPLAVRLALVEGAVWLFAAGWYFRGLRRPGFRGKRAIQAAILFQALDLYTLKGELAVSRTVGLTVEENQVNVLQPAPYSERRSPIDYGSHPRSRLVPQVWAGRGTLYWSTDSYLFTDPPSNLGRADHWLRPLDDYLRSFQGDLPRESGFRPSAYRMYDSMLFPSWIPAANKLSGISEDKIQFFSAAHGSGNDASLGQFMAEKGFSGDLLFVRPEDGGLPPEPMPEPSRSERVTRGYRVTRFDANRLDIEVEDAQAGDWLYYADVWHPGWSATVNGKPRPVARANLAYKAVLLGAGRNAVTFRYHSAGFAWCAGILNWNSMVWVVLLSGFMIAEAKRAIRRVAAQDEAGKRGATEA
jgi:hypothetical protein